MSRFTYTLLISLFACWLLTTGPGAKAQEVHLHGTVYNMYRTRPLDAVSVICTCGQGTTTDSNGNYYIVVHREDSVYFSYLGRSTMKYPVSSVNTLTGFDIALHVDPVTLKEISVMPRNYRQDSLQNRKDYEQIFDFRKPGFRLTSPSSGTGVGVDLDELINALRVGRTRRILAFQRRLEDEEHDKFIDHRFTPYVVKQVTHLEGPELDTFMAIYRPTYLFCEVATDYDFLEYIKLAYKLYQKAPKIRPGDLKKENIYPGLKNPYRP